MRTVFVAILVLLGASLPVPAAACTCAAPTVAELHGKAQVLVLVRVEPAITLVEADGKPYRTWPYDLVDTYKGDLKADWLWSWVNDTSCDTHLAAGDYYLVATNGDGYVSFCDVRSLAGDPAADGEIQVLNAFRAGAIPALTQPWEFAESAEACRLSHRFSSGLGLLQFFFRFKAPERYDTRQYRYPAPLTANGENETRRPVEDRGMHESYEPGFMNLRVSYPFGEYAVERTGRVTIGEREWTTRRTLMEAPFASGYEVIDEKNALEILATLGAASSISIAWEVQELPEYMRSYLPAYPTGTAETSVLFFSDSIERFRACLARSRCRPGSMILRGPANCS